MSMGRKLLGLLLGGGVWATLAISGASGVEAAGNGTCSGGTVAAGTYASLKITGFCQLNGGNVTVRRNVEVTSTGALNALFAGSRLTVGRDLVVDSGGLLALGCDPLELPCQDKAGATSSHRIGRNLSAIGAVLMIVHDNRIGGNVSQKGGGGGFSCSALFTNGPPAYTDYANNKIGGSASVTGLRTCWNGFSRNAVDGDVRLSDNQTAIPDGNLVDGNQIEGDLSCFTDSPAPHLSDGSTPTKNVVGDEASGQCAAISTSDED